ncbi:hypothetical protein D3C80_729350 [compost metagenome]
MDGAGCPHVAISRDRFPHGRRIDRRLTAVFAQNIRAGRPEVGQEIVDQPASGIGDEIETVCIGSECADLLRVFRNFSQ